MTPINTQHHVLIALKMRAVLLLVLFHVPHHEGKPYLQRENRRHLEFDKQEFRQNWNRRFKDYLKSMMFSCNSLDSELLGSP
jgi:hypothetical protein